MDSKNNSDREFTGEIKRVLKGVGNEKLSLSAQTELWERIERQSLNKPTSYNWKLYMQIAAILLLISGIGIWQYQQNTSTHKLLDFAAAHAGKKIGADSQQSIKAATATSAASSADVIEDIITTKDFNTLVVGNGKRSFVKLPDGTEVWLNSGSRLIYPVAFSGDVREVYLEGEAYFDVTHDKQHPFHVRANKMDIKVLGTEFYVSSNADSDRNYAVLVEGSIAFSTGTWLNKIERQLVPGQRINYNLKDNKLSISEVKTAEFQSWKEGFVDVHSESLDLIVQRVAKYYNIEISTQHLDLSNEKFSGRLDFQRNADDVLNILCAGTPYVYNGVERRLELRKR